MGPRIREDNGWDRGGFPRRLHEGRRYAGITGVGARMTGWARGWEVGEGDGSPHPRGQRMGQGRIPALRLHWGRLYAGITDRGALKMA